MSRPALFASEEKTNPVLVVDKKGALGTKIAKELARELLVVLVTYNKPKESDEKNIILVPYVRKFPTIPDNVYSHILLFDENDEGIRQSLPPFIKKAEKDSSSLTYLSHISEDSQKYSEKITTAYKKFKAILYGDIFGDEATFLFSNLLNKIITQASESGKINLPNEGLSRVYPVLFEDVIENILSAVFGAGKEKIFFLFPKHPKSLISIAHIFQKKDPMINIDFTKTKKTEKDVDITISGEYLLGDDYDVSKKIGDLELETEHDFEGFEFNKEDSVSSSSRRFNLLPYIFFFLFLLILPILSTGFFAGLGAFQLMLIKNDFDKGNMQNLGSSFRNARRSLDISLAANRIFEFQAGAVGLSKISHDISYKIEGVRKITIAGTEAGNTVVLSQNILSGKAEKPQDDSFSSIASFRRAINLIQETKLTGELEKRLVDRIEKYNSLLSFSYGVSDVFYSVLSPQTTRSYLILFQNNMELRPGGGFIGSYGILTLNRGKITDFSIHDVYNADGQLKEHVEPPYAIRRYIPLVHWYLRDSNFDVDFAKSASQAASFLFLETGQKVDGVIAADVTFVKELIGVLGDIYVPEYKEVINEDNFYEKTQSHVEKDFFPSSTQKKDFLSALFNAIQNNLSSRKNLPYASILDAFFQAVEEKHILFAFSDNRIQNIFSANGWSSRLDDFRSNASVNDFLGINEANLGVNKANYFIGRSVRYEANIADDGVINSTAILNLKNDSDKWPGGDYKMYVRFIVPQGSVLSKILIDGEDKRIVNAIIDPLIYEKKGFSPPAGFEVEKYDENGKTIYGFLTIVPSKKSQKIEVSYTLPKKISLKSPLADYSLKLFKQPGTDIYPFEFILSHPNSVTVSTEKEHSVINGNLVISKTIPKDEVFEIGVSRK